MSQVVPSLGLINGNDYQLTFWVGTPTHVPGQADGQCGASDPTCLAAKVSLFSVTFSNATTLQQLGIDVISVPNPGQWQSYTILIPLCWKYRCPSAGYLPFQTAVTTTP